MSILKNFHKKKVAAFLQPFFFMCNYTEKILNYEYQCFEVQIIYFFFCFFFLLSIPSSQLSFIYFKYSFASFHLLEVIRILFFCRVL